MSTSVFTLKGLGLKCDTAESIEPHLQALKDNDEVTTVVVGGNTFGIGACEELALLLKTKPTLVEADLADIFTGRLISEIPQALSSLCNSLLNLNNLTVVDLSDNAFGGRCVDSMVPFLSSHLPLQELRLANNGLGPAGATVIADAIYELGLKARQTGQPSRLRKIICGRNRCENGSAQAWGRAFEVHSELAEVRLYQNDIRNHGWDPIMAGLASCSKLEVLDMWDNTATEKGSQAVANALPSLKHLRELNLGDCLLRPRGGAMIARALQEGHNPDLELLKLSGSEIDEEVVGLLVDFVTKHGHKLKRVELNDNFGDPEAAEELTGVWGQMKEALDSWPNGGEMDELDEIAEADPDDADGDESDEAAEGSEDEAKKEESVEDVPNVIPVTNKALALPSEDQSVTPVAPPPQHEETSNASAAKVTDKKDEVNLVTPQPPSPPKSETPTKVPSQVEEPPTGSQSSTQAPADSKTAIIQPEPNTSSMTIATPPIASVPITEETTDKPGSKVTKEESSSGTLHDLLTQTMKALKIT